VPSIPTITAPSWLETARREPDRPRTVGLALAIVVVEVILARGVAAPETALYVFAFLGLFVFAAVFRFPMATALVFLGLTDFIFHPGYFAHEVGSLSIRPHELVLGCLLVLAAVRPLRRTWGGQAGAALAAFLALALVSAALAVSAGDTTLQDVMAWGRPFFLLTFFYVVVRLFPEAEQRRLLLTGAAVLAALTGVIAALISFGGSGLASSLVDSSGQLIREEAGAESIERVRLAGLSAGYALFWYCVVRIGDNEGRLRLLWLAILGGISLDIAVSLNRNMWLGLLIGGGLMAVVGGTRIRHRMAVGGAIAVAGVALLLVFGSSSSNDSVVQPIVKRGETIFKPGETTAESSLEAREKETDEAIGTARDHLLLGVGVGAPFGVESKQPISTGSFIIGTTQVPQLFLHNQYLYLVLVAGIPGLIAFLLFLGLPLVEAFRRRPRDPAASACAVGIAMIMVSAVVALYFSTEDMTAVLGLLAGILVADREGLEAGELTDSGLRAAARGRCASSAAATSTFATPPGSPPGSGAPAPRWR
jgi:O-antigen ligase